MLRTLTTLAIVATCSTAARAETLNSFRHANGLPALHRSGPLQTMAQRHARSMAGRRSMDHADFHAEHGRSGARAENVAAGCASESCVMSLWAESSGHRANMLLSDVRNYGLASAVSGGTRYWCLVLGR
jgi:uncharacterized protein YkwD